MPESVSPILLQAQLETLAEVGEERTAEAGEVLFEVGDPTYPLMAILEGEAAIQDAAGNEIVRHGASGFLGEMNLLSGQTVFLTAVATQPMRYIAVDREHLRPLLTEDGPLSELLLTTFINRREALQRRENVGIEVIGPRSSTETRRILEFANRNRLPFQLHDPEHAGDRTLTDLRRPGSIRMSSPSSGCPAGSGPESTERTARSRERSASASNSAPARRSTCS